MAAALRIGLPVGAGYWGEEIVAKESWVRHLGAEVHVASRVDPKVHWAEAGVSIAGLATSDLHAAWRRLHAASASTTLAYTDPRFTAPVTAADVARAEALFGQSLDYVASLDRRFYDRRRRRDVRSPEFVKDTAARWARFFDAWLREHRVDVILTTLEDTLFCVSLAFVAKAHGIPVVTMQAARFGGRGVTLVEGFNRVLPLHARPLPTREQLLAATQGIQNDAEAGTAGFWSLRGAPARLAEAARRSWPRHRARVVAAYPAEAALLPGLPTWRMGWLHAVGMMRSVALRSILRPPAPGQPYVFFGLHYEDDATITFQTPFLDQVGLALDAVRRLPATHELWVKPHPHYWGTDQPLRSLRRIASHPRIRILPPRLKPGPLVRDAAAVLTVNGTISLEAMILGTPVVAVGGEFFCVPEACAALSLDGLFGALSRPRGLAVPVPAVVNEYWRDTFPYTGTQVMAGLYGMTDEESRRFGALAGPALAGARRKP